jgi:hypothetical protein
MAPFKKVDISIVDMAFGISATAICPSIIYPAKAIIWSLSPCFNGQKLSIAAQTNESNPNLTFPEHKS